MILIETTQHESVFEGLEAQGVGRRRSRDAPQGGDANLLNLALPSIKRWLKLRRESGDVEPSPIPGPPAKKGAMLEGWLPGQQLQNEPDLTLEEHYEAFEEASGVKVSTATMSRRISGLPGGWPLKKV